MTETFPPELERFADPETSRRVVRWTRSAARDNPLYFTTFSVTRDEKWLVFLSERTGRVNLFAADRSTGAIHRISDNPYGVLRSYCWPWGGKRGLSKASPALDPDRGRVYYIQDDALWTSPVADPAPEKLWELPVDWLSNFTHVSPDGEWVCVPVADPRAHPSGLPSQGEQLELVPRIMEALGLRSRIYLVETRTGRARIAAEVPFWVSHVQFDPSGSGRIIFNREGTRLASRPRTWCLEPDGSFRPLYDQPAEEHANHENWTADGSKIVYHGKDAEGRAFFAARGWEGELVDHAEMPPGEGNHVTPTLDGNGFVTDAYDGTVKLMRRRGDAGFETITLCRHDTRFGAMIDQDDHVHPLVTPSGDAVVFASNRGGVADVYEVDIRDLRDGA